MNLRIAITGIATAVFLISSQANASTLVKNISFSATNFSPDYGTRVPFGTVTGDFTITFDPTLSYFNQTAGIVFNNLDLTIDSTIGFNYEPTGGTYPGQLVIGGLEYGAGILAYPTNDFVFIIRDITSSPTFFLFAYGQKTPVGSESFSTTGSVTVSDVAAAVPVPEPATWLSMILGLGMIGGGLRRRQRQTVRCNLA